MSPKSMAMILNITETIHKLKMPFDRGCSMRLYNNNNMRKLHHPNNSNLKLPCPLSNILAETEVVLEVIPQQLHPILFHLISIMAMVHRYILVVSKFPEQKSS